MLQVGTRNMQNFALLQAVGSAGKPVLLKRGFSATIEEWLMAAEYIAQRGNLDIVLCERGIRTFETATRNTLDISAVPVAQRLSPPAGHRRPVALRRPPRPGPAADPGGHRGRRGRHHRRRAPGAEAALCDGDQALLDSDIRELASVAAHLPPLMGRTLTPPLDPPAAAAGQAPPSLPRSASDSAAAGCESPQPARDGTARALPATGSWRCGS